MRSTDRAARRPASIAAAFIAALVIFLAGIGVGRIWRGTSSGTVPPSSSASPSLSSTSGVATSSGAASSTTVTPTTARPGGELARGIPAPFDARTKFPDLASPNPTITVRAGATAPGSGSASSPFPTISAALAAATAGDVVMVEAGTYPELVRSVRDGTVTQPIRIVGRAGAVIQGMAADEDRLVEFNHSYLTLEGFRLTGADKLLWLQKTSGVRILGNTFDGAGGECIRLKFFATDNEVARNTIRNCGSVNFTYPNGSGKNGEGVYIGTAPEQRAEKNPTDEVDASDRNWVHGNDIQTRAECVDIKEGASANLVESNRCTGQLDPNGSAFDSRGNGNFFVANVATNVVGAGVRLGGDTPRDGADNVVIGNELRSTGGYAVKLENPSQRAVCGNTIGDNAAGSATRNDGTPIYRPEAPC